MRLSYSTFTSYVDCVVFIGVVLLFSGFAILCSSFATIIHFDRE